MNKEIKDRLDKLENELKESKDEIHSLRKNPLRDDNEWLTP